MNTVAFRISAAVTVLSLALPLAASAQTSNEEYGLRDPSWSATRVIRTFTNPGGTTSASFDNQSIDNSGFDFAAYYGHPCYEPVGIYLQESCSLRFGVFGNLKSGLVDAQFRAALVSAFGPKILDLVTTANEDVAEAEAEAQADEASDVVELFGNTRDRRIQLWNICKERFANNPQACYQDNVRLLGQGKISIAGNVYHRSSVSQ